MMPYSSTDAAMMIAPLGVKLSVVTPVRQMSNFRVSFLLMALPCGGGRAAQR
jgi:hypothetical protein